MAETIKSLTVPGSLDSLDAVARYVDDIAKAAQLDRQAAYRLRLAVDELATNIIVHGYQQSHTTGDLDFAATLDHGRVVLTVEDRAPAFDPRGRPVPAGMDLPLAERPIGGLGLYLVEQSMDETQYERVDDVNRNTLVLHRSPAPSRDKG
jgi:serine/threonine-protein kinase RsbW